MCLNIKKTVSYKHNLNITAHREIMQDAKQHFNEYNANT